VKPTSGVSGGGFFIAFIRVVVILENGTRKEKTGMVDPIKAIMLATVVSLVIGAIASWCFPIGSDWVLVWAAGGFMATLLVFMLLGIRKP
jgi:hypothetical protein